MKPSEVGHAPCTIRFKAPDSGRHSGVEVSTVSSQPVWSLCVLPVSGFRLPPTMQTNKSHVNRMFLFSPWSCWIWEVWIYASHYCCYPGWAAPARSAAGALWWCCCPHSGPVSPGAPEQQTGSGFLPDLSLCPRGRAAQPGPEQASSETGRE